MYLLKRSATYQLYTHLFSGLLEAPSLPPQLNIETVSYKIILTGKPAIGKTSTVAKLLGQGDLSTAYLHITTCTYIEREVTGGSDLLTLHGSCIFPVFLL